MDLRLVEVTREERGGRLCPRQQRPHGRVATALGVRDPNRDLTGKVGQFRTQPEPEFVGATRRHHIGRRTVAAERNDLMRGGELLAYRPGNFPATMRSFNAFRVQCRVAQSFGHRGPVAGKLRGFDAPGIVVVELDPERRKRA